jgi:hypothetical protein
MSLPIEPADYNIYLAGGRTFVPPEEPLVPPPAEPVYFFIQFAKALTLEERKYIQDKHDLRFNRYIQNFAFLERLDFQSWKALADEPLYRAIERYQPEYRISPHLITKKNRRAKVRVVLFFETSDEDINKIINIIVSLRTAHAKAKSNIQDQAKPKKSSVNAITKLDNRPLGGDLQLVFSVPNTEVLLALAEIEEVQWIEEVFKPQSDSLLNEATQKEDGCPLKNFVAGTIQSGYPGKTPLWNNDLNGKEQIIGLLDEHGPDITHCMLRDDTGKPIGVLHRKIVGFRNPSGSLDIHATLVAGISAGDQASLPGKSKNRGIAWVSKVSVDDLGNVKAKKETIFDVFMRQNREQARIHSNSWHENTTDYNLTARNVDNFVYLNEDNLICGSAANSGDREILGPPGTAKNSVCVCAGGQYPDHTQHMDGLPGPTIDGRRKPDICAPGCGINSAQLNTGCLCMTPGCATSWATPVMAGAAALVRQYYVEGFYPDGVRNLGKPHYPSAALIKATLFNSTVPMENIKQYPNGRTGWGLIKLDNTVFLSGAPRRLFMTDVRNQTGLSTGQSHSFSIMVTSDREPLKITVVWTDPPAELSTGKALVNDLDLVVASPDKKETYRGNTNFVDGFSQPYSKPAPANPNNVEMVIVSKPTPGAWEITVQGKAVNVGLQGYALVATGA